MRHLVALVALAGCSALPPPRGGVRAVEFDIDARFGTDVGLDLPLLRTGVMDYNSKNGTAFLAMWWDAGRDDRGRDVEDEFTIWTFDPADPSDLDELDAPDLIARGFQLAHALTPGQILLVEYGDVPVLYAWDGEEWHYVEPAVGLDHEATIYLMVAPDRIFASAGGAIAVYNGTMWLTVPAPAGSVLGPLAADRFRTVASGLCTIEWSLPALQQSTPACADGGGSPAGLAVNGTPDAFFASDGVRLWRFADDAWTADAVDRPGVEPFVTNGPGKVVWQGPAGGGYETFPSYRVLDDTFTERALLPPFSPQIACTCDRATDPDCGCGNPFVDHQDFSAVMTADTIDLLLILEHQGARRAYVRRFDGPTDVVPFSDADAP